MLSTEIPLFKRWLDKAKAKDKKDRIEKVEEMVDIQEEKVSDKIVMTEDEEKDN